VFQVEMRDLDGNSNREKYALHFLVPALPVLYSPLIWAAAGGAGGGLVLAALGAAIYLKLRRRPEPVRAALDASRAYAGFPGAAVVLDRDGRIVDLTGRRPECLGLPVDLARELLGRPAALLPLFQSERAKRALERLIAGEELLLDAVPLVPGQPRTAQVRGVPLLGRGGVPGVEPVSGAVLLVEEVTGVRRAAEVRERARRLSSLQELAGRIASELSSGGGDPRWSDLLRTLRRIAGEEDLRPESFSLAGLIDALLGKSPLNGRGVDGALKIPPGVELDLREQTGLWLVLADPRALELALRELLKNAVEAMPDGGRLTIRLRNRRLDDDPGELSPGAYLEVEVGDSGPGFPQAELHRAFEPFFSTKPRDRARGVGLSVAYGLVRRQGGDIRLASVPGEGTTVTLYLPADPGS
jgi:signal transduction histidine kinase